jgi:hypothetical protein
VCHAHQREDVACPALKGGEALTPILCTCNVCAEITLWVQITCKKCRKTRSCNVLLPVFVGNPEGEIEAWCHSCGHERATIPVMSPEQLRAAVLDAAEDLLDDDDEDDDDDFDPTSDPY